MSEGGKRLAHWYIAGDGQHRTVAYRQAGRTRIGADIDWESYVRPHRYLVCDDEQMGLALWEVADDGWVKYRIALTREKAEVALALGSHHTRRRAHT